MKALTTLFSTTLLIMVLSSTNSQAKDLGDSYLSKERFQVRLRAVGVIGGGDGMVTGTALETDAGNAMAPEIDLTYFITENIAAELIAATTRHDIYAGQSELGQTWVLPPTLTLQYHFRPDSNFSPYVGVGINYSNFYDETNEGSFTSFDVQGGWGIAGQIGFDYWLNENWGLNLDAKYVDLDVDVNVNNGATRLSAPNVDLDPWIVGAGVSYRF